MLYLFFVVGLVDDNFCSVAAAPTTAATSAIFFRIVFDLSDVSVVGIPFVRFFVHFIVKAAALLFIRFYGASHMYALT